MAKADARALLSSQAISPLPARSALEWVGDALRFIRRPAPYTARHRWNAALVAALVAVFAFDLAADWLISLAIDAADTAGGFLPAPIQQDTPFAEELFYALLIAPLLEEAVYRGWLTGRRAALRFAVFGFAAEACFIASLGVDEPSGKFIAGVGAVIAMIGFIQWIATREQDTAIPPWFARHFHWLVWGSSGLFALIHLGNYEALTHPLGVVVVAPQLIGGLFLAYVRTRLGLRAAMVYHAAYNALVLALGTIA